MKTMIALLIVFTVQPAFAGVQFSRCTNPELQISICQSTAAVHLKTAQGLEELKELPLDLRESSIYANRDRSVLAQPLRDGNFLLVDGAGRRFTLQCELFRPGICR
jgi:hypothetical protein